jgi:hypothetical protein
MRFFSNEAKESADDREAADNENDRARAEADGGGVPQQRTGSPWSDAPGNADASTSTGVADPETRDDSVEESPGADDGSLRADDGSLGSDDEALPRDDSEVRHDGDDLVRDADSPRDAGSPREDDPLDLPLDDRPGSHRADLDGNGTGPVDEEPGAEQRAGTTTTYGPDGTLSTVDGPVEPDATSFDTAGSGTAASEGTVSDAAVSDTVDSDTVDSDTVDSDTVDSGSGTVESRTVDSGSGTVDSGLGTVDSGSSTVGSGFGTADSGAAASDGATDDEGDRELDEAAPVVATAPVETTTASDETGTPAEVEAAPAVPVGAAEAATAAKPDPSAAPVGDKLFTEGDSFTERLRDIALNFVDDPKDATAQAGALVDEAIDKVTSALKAQKDALAGEGDDTERLRVELRGYRDILKRISSL